MNKDALIPSQTYSKPVECKNEYLEIPKQKSLQNSSESTSASDIYREINFPTNKWIEKACLSALNSVKNEGGPFGAIIVQVDNETNEILRYWESSNCVTKNNDPTAHAEVMAIRNACSSLGVFNLGEIQKDESKLSQPGEYSHCVIFSSCEPCPMCFSAISWARIPELYFAASRFDAAQPGVNFSDAEIYSELELDYQHRKMKIHKCAAPNSQDAFNLWQEVDKKEY